MTPEELVADPWAFGPFCWCIAEVRLLQVPIPCRGMPGLWPMPADLKRSLFIDCGEVVSSGLTLQQPYATAIAGYDGIVKTPPTPDGETIGWTYSRVRIPGPKRVENRDWRRTVPPGGMWIGLHAGKALYGGAGHVRTMLAGWRRGAVNPIPGIPVWADGPQIGDLPLGVLLGAMRIDEILKYPTTGSLL